jgi:transcriptional regulator with XRE-family HTH domain
MSYVTKIIGERLRNRRKELGWSQEFTAEKADMHPTYIGQVERGEKNATIDSVTKICTALQYPMDSLFQHIVIEESPTYIANECFEIINQQPKDDQEYLLFILQKMIEYKNK